MAQATAYLPKRQQLFSNPQTELICAMLELTNPNASFLGRASYSLMDLSMQLDAKKRLEEEDDDDEADDDDENDAEHSSGAQPDSIEATASDYMPSLVTVEEETFESTEYDPLSTGSISGTNMNNRNPEEVLIDDLDDDEDVADDPPVTATNDAPLSEVYSPQVMGSPIILDVGAGYNDVDDEQPSGYVPASGEYSLASSKSTEPVSNSEEISVLDDDRDE